MWIHKVVVPIYYTIQYTFKKFMIPITKNKNISKKNYTTIYTVEENNKIHILTRQEPTDKVYQTK